MDNLYAIGGLMDKVPGMGGGDAPDMGGQKTELVKLFSESSEYYMTAQAYLLKSLKKDEEAQKVLAGIEFAKNLKIVTRTVWLIQLKLAMMLVKLSSHL